MDLNTDVLYDIGLTNAQIRVYMALLELGESTTGPILKKSELQNSVVYNALNRLIEQGLVTFVLKGKRKHFSATDPKNLIQYIQTKKEKVEELVPKLIAKQTLAKSKQEAQVFLGWKGVQNAFNMMIEKLPPGSDYIGFAAGVEEQAKEEVRQFFRELQKKRAQKNYKIKFIVNESERKNVQEFHYYKKYGKPEYRYVPGFAPVGLTIFRDCILNIAFEDQPVAVIITSKQIADSYRRFFYAMWEVAKP